MILQRKICMLGAFSVGKTSLVKRYVSSIFEDKYLTTIGVKVDKKIVSLESKDVTLMLWDLAGEDDYNSIKTRYLRGSSGYILVVDGTRPKTLETAMEIDTLAKQTLGEVPAMIALNKSDLVDDWLIPSEDLSKLESSHTLLHTSAKTGGQVEELFRTLTKEML